MNCSMIGVAVRSELNTRRKGQSMRLENKIIALRSLRMQVVSSSEHRNVAKVDS